MKTIYKFPRIFVGIVIFCLFSILNSAQAQAQCQFPAFQENANRSYKNGDVISRNGKDYKVKIADYANAKHFDGAYAPGTGSDWEHVWEELNNPSKPADGDDGNDGDDGDDGNDGDDGDDGDDNGDGGSNSDVWKENKTKKTISLKNSNYKVGVGTSSTGGHKLAIEGSIGAREIKVESKSWADFVFEADYNLPTLIDVENHIKEKGHLKDIPSAKEVETSGVFLGQMDAKLLQKIEELTLYTIQQEKEIQKLKIENADNAKKQIKIDNLNKQIKELKKENTEIMKLFQQLLQKQG